MKTILIIEDDPILLKMYAKKFEKDGFQVSQAVDGQDGLDKLANSEPAAILLDIMLPKVDGFEVLRRIKEDPKTKDIPVVLSTNLGGGEEDRKKGQDLGAADYLIKSDNTPAQIVEKIKGYIK
ncbi:MAG: OmpR family response regulator [Berkelbacteria bacterium GW2011_GWA1_39_10]|uniref:OmpR family response regulator n=1 Tax=Berkelbacteria bacterium GW2011_GWA1_39_10 TaxID=1618332 RepID=A0A0G0LHS3_9BACT|nr:MAG: OmpR family response regulator [Berkelbacteria bacterium GW2011_GWA1_39_10]